MTELTHQDIQPASKKRGLAAKMGKRSFTAWIIYQTVKGTLTTTFIWVPAIYYYFTG